MFTSNTEVQQYYNLLQSLGKVALSQLFPNDFEIYILSFELVDSSDKVSDMLIFPVMPSSIRYAKSPINSIRKTAKGIVSLNSSTFNPTPITLSGNFGRKIRLLLGREVVDFAGVNLQKNFSDKIKTGYGVIKVLESIFERSKQLDSQGLPYKLYFYNPALGHSFLVKVGDYSFRQSVPGENMIWNYEVPLIALAPLNGFINKSDLQTSLLYMLGSQFVSQQIENYAGNLKQGLNQKVLL